jgi:hypothetical protein
LSVRFERRPDALPVFGCGQRPRCVEILPSMDGSVVRPIALAWRRWMLAFASMTKYQAFPDERLNRC